MLPMLGISYVSYEFPSLIAGIIGMGVTAGYRYTDSVQCWSQTD